MTVRINSVVSPHAHETVLSFSLSRRASETVFFGVDGSDRNHNLDSPARDLAGSHARRLTLYSLVLSTYTVFLILVGARMDGVSKPHINSLSILMFHPPESRGSANLIAY